MSNVTLANKYSTVDEVFRSLPVADVMSLEVQFRAQAASKRSELHQLVGESYRDLLTTADTIVTMRNKTAMLREQLTTLADACDSKNLSRNVANLQSFPNKHERGRRKVIQSYLTDLQGLVIYYMQKDELIMATRLYVFGQLLSQLTKDIKPSLSSRMTRLKHLLMRQINQCKDIHEFACSFALMESATPVAALRYFLSLQITLLSSCQTLKDLASSMLKALDSTREFSHLTSAFEHLARKSLSSSIKDLPEIDGSLLCKSISSRLLDHKPEIRADPLSQDAVDLQVQEWMDTTGEQIRKVVTSILERQSDLSILIQQMREVRNLFDEASQLTIYETILPSIELRLSSLLSQSLSAISGTKYQMLQLLHKSQPVESLWICRMPWTKSSLSQFTRTTNRVIRGDSASFHSFETLYEAAINTVQRNLQILGRAKAHTSRREIYARDVATEIRGLQTTLFTDMDRLSDSATCIQVLRLLKYLSDTSPVPIGIGSSSVTIFKNLIKIVPYVETIQNMSKAFDDGLPVFLSASANQWLMDYAASTSDIGIDIVGKDERSVIRNTMIDALVSSQNTNLSTSTTMSNGDSSQSKKRASMNGDVSASERQTNGHQPAEGVDDESTPLQEVSNNNLTPTESHTESTDKPELDETDSILPHRRPSGSAVPVTKEQSSSSASISLAQTVVAEPSTVAVAYQDASTTDSKSSPLANVITESELATAKTASGVDEQVVSHTALAEPAAEANDDEKEAARAVVLQRYFDKVYILLLLHAPESTRDVVLGRLHRHSSDDHDPDRSRNDDDNDDDDDDDDDDAKTEKKETKTTTSGSGSGSEGGCGAAGTLDTLTRRRVTENVERAIARSRVVFGCLID